MLLSYIAMLLGKQYHVKKSKYLLNYHWNMKNYTKTKKSVEKNFQGHIKIFNRCWHMNNWLSVLNNKFFSLKMHFLPSVDILEIQGQIYDQKFVISTKIWYFVLKIWTFFDKEHVQGC